MTNIDDYDSHGREHMRTHTPEGRRAGLFIIMATAGICLVAVNRLAQNLLPTATTQSSIATASLALDGDFYDLSPNLPGQVSGASGMSNYFLTVPEMK